MSARTIRLIGDGIVPTMAEETGLSRAVLDEVGAGRRPETLRLFVPGRSVAFGKHDAATPGFPDAVAAARATGFEPYLRLAGGRAAAFHERTIALSWAIPDPRPIDGIYARFTEISDLLADSIADLGLPAAVGELPGEYCPGAFSVHVGTVKVAGIGQRLTKTAAHVGGVIVVGDGDRVRAALSPVYEALGLEWDPSTAGALADLLPDLDVGDVIDVISRRISRIADLVPATMDASLLVAAKRLGSDHRIE